MPAGRVIVQSDRRITQSYAPEYSKRYSSQGKARQCIVPSGKWDTDCIRTKCRDTGASAKGTRSGTRTAPPEAEGREAGKEPRTGSRWEERCTARDAAGRACTCRGCRNGKSPYRASPTPTSLETARRPQRSRQGPASVLHVSSATSGRHGRGPAIRGARKLNRAFSSIE